MKKEIIAPIGADQNSYTLGYINGYSDMETEEEQEPQGLDEAAEEYARTTFTHPYSKTPEKEITITEPDKFAAFKAGANWYQKYLNNKLTWKDIDAILQIDMDYSNELAVGDKEIPTYQKQCEEILRRFLEYKHKNNGTF